MTKSHARALAFMLGIGIIFTFAVTPAQAASKTLGGCTLSVGTPYKEYDNGLKVKVKATWKCSSTAPDAATREILVWIDRYIDLGDPWVAVDYYASSKAPWSKSATVYGAASCAKTATFRGRAVIESGNDMVLTVTTPGIRLSC